MIKLKEKKLIKNKKKTKEEKKEVQASGLEATHEAWASKNFFMGQTTLNLF